MIKVVEISFRQKGKTTPTMMLQDFLNKLKYSEIISVQKTGHVYHDGWMEDEDFYFIVYRERTF